MKKDDVKELWTDLTLKDPVDIKLELAWRRGGKAKRSIMLLFAAIQWAVVLVLIAAFFGIASQ